MNIWKILFGRKATAEPKSSPASLQMEQNRRTVRVFVSSTFRDMHAERDHLVIVVFPELRERCERLGLEFFDVDLRWGVPEKGADGEKANSWEYCRQWIDRSQPFFIGLLGQRYGWEPEPGELKNAADRRRQERKKRSITDMEVSYAVLDEPKLKLHTFFYLRETQAPNDALEFVDPEVEKRSKMEALKSWVQRCGRPVRKYTCQWNGDRFSALDDFGKAVLDDLWSAILRNPRYVSLDAWRQVLGQNPKKDPRYTNENIPVPGDIAEKLVPLAKPAPKSPLEAERAEMQSYADSRLRWFQGRDEELQQLLDFIHDPAADDRPRLAYLAAEPGQGKSALMAKLSSVLSGRQRPLYVITHFAGATSNSTSSFQLVKRLLDELDASGIKFRERPDSPGALKEDFQSLCQRLWDRLRDYDGDKRIVVLIDALNQLDDGHELGWLPHNLGPSVRLVVSCIENSPSMEARGGAKKILAALDTRHPKPKRIELSGLSPEDVRNIVTSYLREYCKELDMEVIDTICDETRLPQARNPLYLQVMLNELRTLGGNDMNRIVPELIGSMLAVRPDAVHLFHWVLERMENAEGFGEPAVRWWCLYLALGRAGLSGRELGDLLGRKLGPGAIASAKRIERGLRRYLQRRGEQLDFFHGQLRQAVMERYGGEEFIAQGHRDLAAYFRNAGWCLEDSLSEADKSANRRKAGELPWQELQVFLTSEPNPAIPSMSSGFAELLTDWRFIEVKCRAELAHQLQQECQIAIDHSQCPIASQIKEAISMAGSDLAANPQWTLQAFCNGLAVLETRDELLDRTLSLAREECDRRGPWLALLKQVSASQRAAGQVVFSHPNSLRCISRTHGFVGEIDPDSREITTFDLTTGIVRDRRKLPGRDAPASVAVDENSSRFIWVSADGVVHSEDTPASIPARRGDCPPRCLHGGWVLLVNPEDRLLVWSPKEARSEIVAESIPRPILGWSASLDGTRFMGVAGRTGQILILGEKADEAWTVRTIPWPKESISCLALDREGNLAVVGCQNRCLWLIDFRSAEWSDHIFYEKASLSAVHGTPLGCAMGEGDVFFATGLQVALWEPRGNRIQPIQAYRNKLDANDFSFLEAVPGSQFPFLGLSQKAYFANTTLVETSSLHASEVIGCEVISPHRGVTTEKQHDRIISWRLPEMEQEWSAVVLRSSGVIAASKTGQWIYSAGKDGRLKGMLASTGVLDRECPSFGEPSPAALVTISDRHWVAAFETGRVLSLHQLDDYRQRISVVLQPGHPCICRALYPVDGDVRYILIRSILGGAKFRKGGWIEVLLIDENGATCLWSSQRNDPYWDSSFCAQSNRLAVLAGGLLYVWALEGNDLRELIQLPRNYRSGCVTLVNGGHSAVMTQSAQGHYKMSLVDLAPPSKELGLISFVDLMTALGSNGKDLIIAGTSGGGVKLLECRRGIHPLVSKST